MHVFSQNFTSCISVVYYNLEINMVILLNFLVYFIVSNDGLNLLHLTIISYLASLGFNGFSPHFDLLTF